jgi:hypothetical protein
MSVVDLFASFQKKLWLLLSGPDAELEGVGGIEDEGGFGGDVGGAGDGGSYGVFFFGGGVAGFEDAADDAFLTPDFAGGEFAVCGEAGELGAGAGAAGGTVVFGAGAEDEVAAVVRGIVRRGEEFDVIDFGVAGGVEGGADGERGLGELGDVFAGEGEAVVGYQEKPVATIGDVSGEAAGLDGFGFAVGGDVADADAAVGVKGGGDDADGGFDAVVSGGDAAEVAEGDDEADHAVAAHAEEADVVEENDAGGAGGVFGFHEKSADDDFVAAGFAEDGAAVGFEGVRGDAIKDDAGGLAAGVGVDDGDAGYRREFQV